MRLLFFIQIMFIAQVSQAIIFGADDRTEIVSDPILDQVVAPAVAMSIGEPYLLPQAVQDILSLDFVLASDSVNVGLCEEEKFANQPANWLNCTGFMVSDDVMVTAGHCVVFSHGALPEYVVNEQTAMCSDFNWIFDYKSDVKGVTNILEVNANRVYNCEKVLYSEISGNNFSNNGSFINPPTGEYGVDFAIIKLDRKVEGREPLKIASASVAKNDSVRAIGYPMGLPLKVSGNAKVIQDRYKNFFTADLDIIGGNSGGPVLNAQNEVVGIIVRANPGDDFNYDEKRQCSKLKVCTSLTQNDCAGLTNNNALGTHVQRIEPIFAKLKELGVL